MGWVAWLKSPQWQDAPSRTPIGRPDAVPHKVEQVVIGREADVMGHDRGAARRIAAARCCGAAWKLTECY